MRRQRVDRLPARDVEQHAARHQRRDRLGAVRGEAVAPLHVLDLHVAVEAQVARLVAERVDVRPAVLHHRQDTGRTRAWTVLLGAIRVAMPAVQRVEVTRLVRGRMGIPAYRGCFEIEDLRARDPLPQLVTFMTPPTVGVCDRDWPPGTQNSP